MKTWHVEFVFVALTLAVVTMVSGNHSATAWIGAAAVLLTFGHVQVSDRMAEREARRAEPDVACHRWSTRYLVGKEMLWCLYFVQLRAWPALAGVALFLAYPLWRKFYRTRRPID